MPYQDDFRRAGRQGEWCLIAWWSVVAHEDEVFLFVARRATVPQRCLSLTSCVGPRSSFAAEYRSATGEGAAPHSRAGILHAAMFRNAAYEDCRVAPSLRPHASMHPQPSRWRAWGAARRCVFATTDGHSAVGQLAASWLRLRREMPLEDSRRSREAMTIGLRMPSFRCPSAGRNPIVEQRAVLAAATGGRDRRMAGGVAWRGERARALRRCACVRGTSGESANAAPAPKQIRLFVGFLS